MTNAQVIEGKWDQVKGRVLKKWGLLTEDDMDEAKGNYQLLIGKIQEKTGRGREEIEEFLGECADDVCTTTDRMKMAAEDYAHKAQEYTEEAAEAVRAKYKEAADKVAHEYHEAERLVRSRPTEAVAISFGVGILAGVIIGLATRSR